MYPLEGYMRLFVLIGALIQPAISQSQTTSLTTSGTTVTTNVTSVTTSITASRTTSTTTSTTSATTTISITTTPAITYPSESDYMSNSDIGRCSCDLTSYECDVNCPCDRDCFPVEIQTFTASLETKSLPDPRLCQQDGESVSYTAENLLCVDRDNNVDRNYFTLPTIARNPADFERYYNTHATDVIKSGSQQPLVDYQSSYKSGSTVLTVFPSGNIGILSLPSASAAQAYCNDLNPTVFLYERDNECSRRITDLPSDCLGLPSLNATSFYSGFKVLKSSGSVNVSNLYSSTLVVDVRPHPTVTCYDVMGIVYNCTELLEPAWDGSICHNVVTEVEYEIGTSGSEISSVTARFSLSQLSTSNINPSAKFRSIYRQVTQTREAFRRSGNPGYVVGENVMAGKYVVVNDVPYIELAKDRDTWLTLPGISPSGECLTGVPSSVPVKYGINTKTSCFLSVTYGSVQRDQDCELLQKQALVALNFSEELHVATYGNSNPNRIGDWISFLWPKTIGSPTYNGGRCEGVILGAHLKIFYSDIGSIWNPQPKIVGAQLVYERGAPLTFQCGSGRCFGGSDSFTQKFEVNAAVSFIDATPAAEAVIALRPQVNTKLPRDFFHPFYFNSFARLTPSILLFLMMFGFYV